MNQWVEFRHNFLEQARSKNSRAILRLNPQVLRLPLPIQRFDDPFLPFVKPTIDRTRPIVVAYWLDLASYLTLGAAGARALERTIGYIGSETPKILHGPFVGQSYSSVVDAIAFAADALTLARDRDLEYYLTHSPYAAFVMRENIIDLPVEGGIFTKTHLAFYSEKTDVELFHITDDDVLFSGHDDMYADAVRATLVQKAWTYHDKSS